MRIHHVITSSAPVEDLYILQANWPISKNVTVQQSILFIILVRDFLLSSRRRVLLEITPQKLFSQREKTNCANLWDNSFPFWNGCSKCMLARHQFTRRISLLLWSMMWKMPEGSIELPYCLQKMHLQPASQIEANSLSIYEVSTDHCSFHYTTTFFRSSYACIALLKFCWSRKRTVVNRMLRTLLLSKSRQVKIDTDQHVA